jgi:outer membrane receptor for ferrienterochelin and colicin
MNGFSANPTAHVAISILGVLLQTSTAIGQTTTGTISGASSDGSELADIVVTARKMTERLQDTPMSVVVITADTIERTSATTLEDLGRETPGLTIVSAAPGQNQIILRGLATTQSAFISTTRPSRSALGMRYSRPILTWIRPSLT